MSRLFPAITIISSWILFRTPVLLHLGKNGTTIRQQNMQAIQAPSLLGASLKPHKTKRKRTQMPVKQRSDMLTYFFVHFSAQLCPTTCAWVLDLKNWTSQLETFVHAGTNGDKRCLDTADLLIVNYQPWSTLVNLGPRLFLLPWPTFLSTLGLPMRQNILMKFTWPSKELKELYDIWNAWKVVQCGAVPQDHPSTGASFFFFFLRRLLSEESDSDSLLLDSFRMRMAENRN